MQGVSHAAGPSAKGGGFTGFATCRRPLFRRKWVHEFGIDYIIVTSARYMVRDVPAIGPKKRLEEMCLPGCPSGKPSGELPAAFRIALKKIDNPQDCMPSGRAFWEAFRLVEKLPACFPACLPGLPEDPLLDFFCLACLGIHACCTQ